MSRRTLALLILTAPLAACQTDGRAVAPAYSGYSGYSGSSAPPAQPCFYTPGTGIGGGYASAMAQARGCFPVYAPPATPQPLGFTQCHPDGVGGFSCSSF